MDNNTTALAVRPESTAALQVPVSHQSGVDALGLMSPVEFTERMEALKLTRARLQQIHQGLMVLGVDYGVIPGTGDKPTLLKSGADKLCQFYRYIPEFQHVVDNGDGKTTPHISVRVTCVLHAGEVAGPAVGSGAGACNSWERKYRWRKGNRKCPKCGKETIFTSKNDGEGFFCWKTKGGCGSKFAARDTSIIGQQLGDVENPDPWDLFNTILKMAQKRAYVDAVLRTTATSNLYTQDLEDDGAGDDIPPPPAPPGPPGPPSDVITVRPTPAPPPAREPPPNSPEDLGFGTPPAPPPVEDVQARVAQLLERLKVATDEDLVARPGSILMEISQFPPGPAKDALVAAGRKRREQLKIAGLRAAAGVS